MGGGQNDHRNGGRELDRAVLKDDEEKWGSTLFLTRKVEKTPK